MVRQNWQMWSGGLSGDELNVVLGAVNSLQTTPATTFCNSDETVRSMLKIYCGNMSKQQTKMPFIVM